MPDVSAHAPGAFCWVEIATVDAARTRAFYSELFGWTFDDRPAGDFGVYSVAQLRGRDVLGLYELSPEMRKQGVPAHLMAYVAVADTDSTCDAVKRLDGAVIQGPFDVMDVGRMAVLADPTGAHFSIWEAHSHGGTAIQGEPGTPCWCELATKGLERAEAFYTELFGWKVKKGSDGEIPYHEVTAPGGKVPMGGMTELRPEHGSAPPHWMVYFLAKEVDASTERASSLGGTILVPPMDIPKVGRFSVVRDPAGAVFAIFQMAQAP